MMNSCTGSGLGHVHQAHGRLLVCNKACLVAMYFAQTTPGKKQGVAQGRSSDELMWYK